MRAIRKIALNWLVQVFQRIDLGAVDQYLKMDMRSGTSSRIAAESDLVSLLDGFSGRNKDFAQMCITGLFAVGMTDGDAIAVAVGPASADNDKSIQSLIY